MCPAMTAPPGSPGRGLPVYQPARNAVGGTCSSPDLVSPRWTSRVRTLIAGMISVTGRATTWALAGGAALRLTDNATLNGSLGVGVNHGDIGGRVGVSIRW